MKIPSSIGGATVPAMPALLRRLAALVVVLAAAALVLHRLGAAEVCGANEAIEGLFVQQMVEHGALLFPLENGGAPMYKPPLFHWTATALDRIGGARKVNSFNLRLPSALYAVAGVALLIAFAWAPLGERGALLAGLILAASYQYVSEGRVGRVDMTLCFFETLALMSCLWTLPAAASAGSAPAGSAPVSGRRLVAPRYVFALALGLGVLAKGPIAVILPLGAIVVFLLRERRFGEVAELFTPGSLFVAIVVGLGWYAACAMGRRYGFLGRQLESENIGRFFGALGFMAPWYYLKPILLDSAPLSLMVPLAVAVALRRAGHRAYDAAASAEARAAFAARLFATFWVITVLFFSVAAYKRRAYLLPLWPASAFLLAWGAQRLARRAGAARAAPGALAALCVLLIGFNFVYLPRHEAGACAGGSFQAAAAQIDRTVGPDEALYLYGFGDDPAPLLFYLDREAPLVAGRLGEAPPGYVIVPERVWSEHASEALDLKPVLSVAAGGENLLLLRRGGAIGTAPPDARRLKRFANASMVR